MITEEPKPGRRVLVIAWTLIAVGVVLRLVQYLSRQSFWADEVPLLQSMMRLDVGGFFYSRLNASQVAPPLFMAVQKLIAELIGLGELEQRAPSMIASFAAMVLMLILARRVLGPIGLLSAVAVLALSDPAIEWAATMKPYSADVAIALLLMLITLRAAERREVSHFALVAILGAILMWMSHATIIVYGAMALVMFVRIATDWRKLLAFCLVNVIPAASIGAMWWLLIRHQQGDDYLRSFWLEDFPNWKQPLLVPWWLVQKVTKTITYPLQAEALAVMLWPLLLIGTGVLWRDPRRRVVAMIGLAPLAVLILMALAGKYPLAGKRVNLFVAPGLLLLIGAGLDWLATQKLGKLKPVAIGVVVLFIGVTLAKDIPFLIRPRTNGHARPIVAYLKQHRQQAEKVYVPLGIEDYRWYWPGAWLIEGWPPQGERGKFWIVFSSTPSRLGREVWPRANEWVHKSANANDFSVPGAGAIHYEVR